MKDKLIILFLFTLSLFIGSCNNATEAPPQEEKSLLTGKIVFISNFSGVNGIYNINPDGTELKQINSTANEITLINSAAGWISLKWSPDGKQITFAAQSPLAAEAVYIMNGDGSNVHLLPTNPEPLARGNWPDWSPDGSKIVFTHSRIIDPIGVYENAIVDLSNSTTQVFKNEYESNVGYISDVRPKWSPDGKKIIFLSDRNNYPKDDLYIMDADGKNVKRLTQYGANSQYGANLDYFWNPSDHSIILSVSPGSADVVKSGIGRIDTAGNLLQFVDLKANTFTLGTLSNDGKKLAFSLDGEIQILDFVSNSMQKLLVNGYAGMKYYPVDWSIDDKELLTISITLDGTHSNLDMINIKKGTFNRLLLDYKILALDWLK